MSYEKEKFGIAKEMQKHVRLIKDTCENFSGVDEAFLYPMYRIVAQSMYEIMGAIALLIEKNKFSGADSTQLIADIFQKNIDHLKETLASINTKEKSHNEQLTEKLLKEAGIQ